MPRQSKNQELTVPTRKTRGTRPGKRGQPPWQPAPMKFRRGGVEGIENQEMAWERVRNWVRMATVTGMQQEIMCKLLNPPCCINTLKKNFAEELAHGREQVTQLIASKLVQDALSGNDRNQRFYLETQAGWNRNPDVVLGALVIRTMPGDEDL